MSEHNQRQYLRMLNQLTRFEEGQIRIDALVDGLEGLFNALENVPESWKSAFLQQWGELEDERAYALFKNLQVFDDETSRRLLLAAAELRRLVLENLEKSAGK